MNNARTKKQQTELESIDLLPRAQALKRSDDLLRAMLNSAPDPHKAKAAAKKRAKK